MARVSPPSASSRSAAQARLRALAAPAGSLGRLGDLAVWLSSVQGQVPPRHLGNVRLVVFAGDHGVARHGVSAYPPALTAAMVRTMVQGRAAVNALAAENGVRLRVLDLGVDADLDDLPLAVRRFKVRRGTRPIHLEDAMTPMETRKALAAGSAAALDEIAGGAQLLLTGDLGVGNSTPAAALVGALLGLPGYEVASRGTGADEVAAARRTKIIDRALVRAGGRAHDPVDALAALGGPDLAATTGFLATAAEAGVPVLLDGLVSVACAMLADRMRPGAAAWFVAGHRSTEPAQSFALARLGLEPVLDLDLRVGDGSGAVAAVPMLRSAGRLLRDVALLSELATG
ncbi:nicotinate-nucleotide--dimethylbenzimidazole phosphoribosyltransferase [Nocardioides sp. GCM10027113]|uniref:nicotinate-nucleotide--dimethylbenzimidazole phosphoribosyltransferase n=1 Tax=unclassified Nocardioides TaxID=2615069 RepID=UPI0036191A7F